MRATTTRNHEPGREGSGYRVREGRGSAGRSRLRHARIREVHEQFAPGGVALEKTEYEIKWRLRKESDGERCYYVEKSEGGTHLYVASAIEHSYEVVDSDSHE